ncbi:MAG TPA: hemolysin family protein [Rhizomicrobium sp.]|jgi:CBS domain containing-hemolysin-like protein|nr:hemolysin family protein [Rhizomicrobium sp.]
MMADTAAADQQQSLLKRLGSYLRGDSATTAQVREAIEDAIEDADRSDAELSAPERRMLANLLKFGDLRVSDVMIPRADIVAVDEDMSFVDFIAFFRDMQHSRIPIYRETLDEPTGLVLIKDVLGCLEAQGDGSFRWKSGTIAQVKRELLFVPPSMPLIDLLLKMQTAHTHLALVIDEYGGTDGLVSIEDIIEEIVGDIADEHDEELQQLRQSDDGTYLADARIELDDFKEQTGVDLATEEAEQEVDTLGGLVVSVLGRVPQRGEIVAHPSGAEFEILEADPRHVKRLRVRLPAAPAAAPTDGKPA